MVTVQEILAAEGEELSRLLGVALHNMEVRFGRTTAGNRSYTKTDAPVPLNWDNAMKFRFEAEADVGLDGYMEALSLAVCPNKPASSWKENAVEISTQARIKHYLQAAAIISET